MRRLSPFSFRRRVGSCHPGFVFLRVSLFSHPQLAVLASMWQRQEGRRSWRRRKPRGPDLLLVTFSAGGSSGTHVERGRWLVALGRPSGPECKCSGAPARLVPAVAGPQLTARLLPLFHRRPRWPWKAGTGSCQTHGAKTAFMRTPVLGRDCQYPPGRSKRRSCAWNPLGPSSRPSALCLSVGAALGPSFPQGGRVGHAESKRALQVDETGPRAGGGLGASGIRARTARRVRGQCPGLRLGRRVG